MRTSNSTGPNLLDQSCRCPCAQPSAAPHGTTPSLPHVRPGTTSGPRQRRPTRSVVLLLALTCLFVAATGVALSRIERLGRTRPAPGAERAVQPTAGPTPTPADGGAAAAAGPAMPTPGQLDRLLRGPLKDPAFIGAPAIQGRDLASGTLLADHRADVPDVPASTAKLLVSTVALSELGPATRFTTRVYAAGDTLFLVGGGDPTLTRRAAKSTTSAVAGVVPGSVEDLARQVHAAGIRHVRTIAADASLFGGPSLAPGWRSYYLDAEIGPVSALTVDEGRAAPATKPTPRTGDPTRQATEAFRGALGGAGIPVAGVRAGKAPPGARLVAKVDSPPVSALVKHMLTYSDNDLAEALGRLVALHQGRPADFGGEAAALLDGLQRLGLPLSGVRMNDTSGLSHDDKVPPALLVEVLRRAAAPDHPELHAIIDGLPVAGRTGTLADRYQTAPS